VQAIASSPLCGHWWIRRHWLAARITAPSAEDPNKRKNYPAEQRAALVPEQNLSRARSLDHQPHGTGRGTVGPIEAELLEYGALDGPDAHAVVGLVLGAFGELSTSC
jgi:hypothetical protein